jgi:hypothetical protein
MQWQWVDYRPEATPTTLMQDSMAGSETVLLIEHPTRILQMKSHEEHTNDMSARTLGAICLGPSGNEQGGHFFMSLATGKRIHRHWWTDLLPLPDDAIARVKHLALRQGTMPRTLTFADRFGFELVDENDDIDDDNDSAYDPADDNSIDNDFVNGSADDNDSDRGNNDQDDNDLANGNGARLPPPFTNPVGIAGVNDPNQESDEDAEPEN